jgi:hypothetical protein
VQEESASHDARKLRIAAFPPGPSIWRIDWFGPIAFPDRMMRRRHPSVLVYLSKVVHPQALTDPSVLLQPDCTLSTDQQIKRWVSVGTTLLLRIGDLWQDQTLLARPTYEQFLADDLQVDRDTVTIVKAGSSFDDGIFLLPLTDHPWHRANTHSYCVRLTLPGNRFLVVPCMEMARFYFGSSSELLSRLFQPPLTKDRLFTKVSTDARGRMWLDLAERLPRASAEDIARIAGSDTAWKAAALISVSCLKASTAGKEVFPQAVFPFEGSTSLQAIGKWLPGGQEHAGTFLAYQLQTCSHVFPFKWLRVKVPGGSIQRTKPPDGAEVQETPALKTVASTPKNPALRERDPSAHLAATTQTLHCRRRFPDLDGKPVTMTRLFAKQAAGGGATTVPAVEDMAIGEAGSGQRIRSMCLVESRSGDEPLDPPDFLRPVVDAIQQLDGVNVQLLTASAEDGWTVPVGLITDEDGVIENALLVEEKSSRPRRVAGFLLSMEDDQVLLVMIESEFLLPLIYPIRGGEVADVWSMMHEATKDFVTQSRDMRDVGISIECSSDSSATMGKICDRLFEFFPSRLKLEERESLDAG